MHSTTTMEGRSRVKSGGGNLSLVLKGGETQKKKKKRKQRKSEHRPDHEKKMMRKEVPRNQQSYDQLPSSIGEGVLKGLD